MTSAFSWQNSISLWPASRPQPKSGPALMVQGFSSARKAFGKKSGNRNASYRMQES